MARRNCLLWKTGRLSETMNRWGSMEPALRHLEPFRRAISINRKSIRCAYTRIHELIAYRLTHSRWREKQKEREKVKEGMSKRGVCSEEIFSYSAMNYIISGRKRLLTREVAGGSGFKHSSVIGSLQSGSIHNYKVIGVPIKTTTIRCAVFFFALIALRLRTRSPKRLIKKSSNVVIEYLYVINSIDSEFFLITKSLSFIYIKCQI